MKERRLLAGSREEQGQRKRRKQGWEVKETGKKEGKVYLSMVSNFLFGSPVL